MLRRSNWLTAPLLLFFVLATPLTSAENAKHSYSISIHENPELIEIANELMRSGSSAGEYIQTLFPEAWDSLSKEMQELMHRTPMQWSGSSSQVITPFYMQPSQPSDLNGIFLVPNTEHPFPGTPYSKEVFEEYGIRLVDSFEEMQASISPEMCVVGTSTQAPDFPYSANWHFSQLSAGKSSIFISVGDLGPYNGKFHQIPQTPGTGIQTLPLLIDGEFKSLDEIFSSNHALAECLGLPINLDEAEDELTQSEYPMWEYSVEDMAAIDGSAELQKLLDQYSRQGWRLLLIENEMIIFERPYDNR